MKRAILASTLSLSRVGLQRGRRKAQENDGTGNATQQALLAFGRKQRAGHWLQQQQAGVDSMPVGDFAEYDSVLNTSLLLGNVPARGWLYQSEPTVA